ncbi:stage II sporulation protein M [Geofilum rubicundum]|uniref:Stage II sporulation protein M n=1 Tax=Geofilum rubicundum JCM 15548 TaxID=1236989 RepID=A0A0E9LV75_9BACT|nr:stage II sporulation protein M [Geofilum rubicundum]GAO29208.1 hypothetical protein JCM15548_11374 [Geofilum rubicundum JCM 15548]
MKEISFININKQRWSAFDDQISRKKEMTPDDLASNYILLTDDLSYARTFYPQSGIVTYLNDLSSRAHSIIYQNKKEKSNRIFDFWLHELPLSIYRARKDFLWSLIIFLGAFLLGWISAIQESDLLRVILGDQYVNLTLDNISKGDPMGVYGMTNPLEMFFYLAFNNIRVSIIAFLFGVLTPLGTALIVFRNGMMLGAFLAFFFQQSLGVVSVVTVMLHGTIELSAIVLAGGAGIMMGRSFLFPGTYPRKYRFVKGAVRGTRIIMGLIPFFILAAVIESYITRHYNQMPLFMQVLIIGLSALLIVGYFIVYPKYVYSNTLNQSKNGEANRTVKKE